MPDLKQFAVRHAEAILCCVAAFFCIVAYAVVVNWFLPRPLFFGAVMCAVYLITVCVILFLTRSRRSDNGGMQQLSPVLGDIMVNTVLKMSSPVVICEDVAGAVYWYNKSFAAILAPVNASEGGIAGGANNANNANGTVGTNNANNANGANNANNANNAVGTVGAGNANNAVGANNADDAAGGTDADGAGDNGAAGDARGADGSTGRSRRAAKSLHGKSIADITGVSIDRYLISAGVTQASAVPREQSVTLSVRTKDGVRSYKARTFPIKTPDRSYALIQFTDVTETLAFKKRLEDENIAVAYIIVDNLDELLQYEQEKYRSTSAQIEAILRSWAADCGGLLKEYERDKYLFFCSCASVSHFTATNFDILDRIHAIRVGDGNLPVTISIGMACFDGTLEEKERAAYAALDLALQRGGDQAAVRTGTATTYHGGRTRTQQKRTRVRARVLAGELVMHISSASNVLVMAHKYPDFDALGAAVGIARLAMFCGTEVSVVMDTSEGSIVNGAAMLKGLNEYRGIFVKPSAALDLIRAQTLLIVVDVNNAAIYECPELAECAEKVVIIDHHRKSAEFSRTPLIAYIEPSASSASELVAEMLEQSVPDGTLEAEEASLLLSGMVLDTKQFKKDTGTRTFSAALYLRNAGADPSEVERLFKSPFDDFVRVSRFEAGLEIYRGNIAIAARDGEGDDDDRVAAAMAADKLLGIAGIDASFALVLIGGVVFVSARSAGNVNVQLILEGMNGGGHFASAGAQIKGTDINGAKEVLKRCVDAYLERDNGGE